MTESDIQQLFLTTLKGDYDDEAPWDAVRELHTIGTQEVLDLATTWCQSDDPLRRARGADILAQLGKSAGQFSNKFPAEAFAALSQLVEKENEIRPLSSAIFALGHLDNPAAISIILRHAANTNSEVRYAVAFALGCYPNDSKAIQALLRLTADEDDDVRDWATFAVGVLGDADTVAIRDALAARLSDTNEDAREEATVALAKRHDQRLLPTLLEMLGQREPSSRVFEAASLLLDCGQDDEKLSRTDYIALLRNRFS